MEAQFHGWTEVAGNSGMPVLALQNSLPSKRTVSRIAFIFQEQGDQERPCTANIFGAEDQVIYGYETLEGIVSKMANSELPYVFT